MAGPICVPTFDSLVTSAKDAVDSAKQSYLDKVQEIRDLDPEGLTREQFEQQKANLIAEAKSQFSSYISAIDTLKSIKELLKSTDFTSYTSVLNASMFVIDKIVDTFGAIPNIPGIEQLLDAIRAAQQVYLNVALLEQCV